MLVAAFATREEQALMARPATGSVIVRKRKADLAYSLRVRAYGERHQIPLGSSSEGWTRAAADIELLNVMTDVRRGVWKPPKTQPAVDPEKVWTFHAWATKCLDDRRPILRVRSIESWEWALCNHLLPAFKDLALGEITKLGIHGYVTEKVRDREYARVERPLSNRSINRTISRLADILEDAVEFDLIATNPAESKRLRLPEEAPKRRWLQVEHIMPMIDAAGPDRALVATLLLAGLRIGEALALPWDAVDLPGSVLHVRQSKTPAGVRSVELTPFLRRELRRELRLQQLASAHSAPTDFVFPTATGMSDSRANVLKRVVHQSAKRANIALAPTGVPPIPEDVTNHDLRRVFSSLLDEVNAPRAYKDGQMGHKAPGLGDAYDRPFKRQRDVGERIDALISDVERPAGSVSSG